MSNPNNQPDLKSMARTRRRSNNRHTTFSQRERLPSRYHDVGPWTVTPPTVPPAPQNRIVQPHDPEAVNHNPAGGAPSTNFFPGPATTHTDTLLPLFSKTHPTNIPKTPTAGSESTPQQYPHSQQTSQPQSIPQQPQEQPQHAPPPKPHLHPSSPSPAPSLTSSLLEDIDLRSPSDDPDYDFIETSEATHSARNAQPDRADKYPELEKGGTEAGSVGSSAGGEKEVKAVAEGKKKGRGWFGFLG
jgi:hypothetical protein